MSTTTSVTRARFAVWAAVAAVAAGGCQVVFDLDGYSRAAASSGAGAAGGASATGTGGFDATAAETGTGAGSQGGGGGGAEACAGLGPEVMNGTGFCSVRALDALNVAGMPLLAPAADCVGNSCDVFFQKGFGDSIQCASCADLAALDCDSPVTVGGLPGGSTNPYLRKGASELWFSSGGEIQHASVQGCTASGVTAADALINTNALEAYPAISPNGKVLFFTRITAGQWHVFVAYRANAAGAFQDVVEVAGIRNGVPTDTIDLRPHPEWIGQDEVERLYFSSTRLGASVTDIEELDIFVAERASGSSYDTPFSTVRLVEALSSPVADLAPLPLSPELWLWARDPNAGGNATQLYAIDRGCHPLFGEPDTSLFGAVNTSKEERDPALDAAGRLLFSQGKSDAELFSSSFAGGAYGNAAPYAPNDVAHVAGRFDRGPVPLADGRLVFVSERETQGVPKLWITAVGGTPSRVTGAPANVAEDGPFIDEAGDLWLSWGGGSDPTGFVIGRAPRVGDGFGSVNEVPGLFHEAGSADSHPRLADGGKVLFFQSTRSGGFYPGAMTVWIATRGEPSVDAWDDVFPVPELGTILGVNAPWVDPNDCSLTLATPRRASGFSLDLARSSRSN